MGQVPGEVVAAAFGVFNPVIVVPMVQMGWALVPAPVICTARTVGAVGQLERILGAKPDGLSRATVVTDQLRRPIIDALGDDFDELIAIVGAWSANVRAAGGYPASGPLDLSERFRDARRVE